MVNALMKIYLTLIGITSHFNSRIVLCGWHLQKNFISHFAKLKKADEALYMKILSLPFVTSEEKFHKIVAEIRGSESISQTQKTYLNAKLEKKEMWAKCKLKSKFLGGISTTSRIEGFHAKQKKYFNSNTNLQGVFRGFRKIEQTQFDKFKEEFSRHKHCQGSDEGVNSLMEIKEHYPEYLYKKICPRFYKGLNYKHEPNETNNW